MAICKCRRGTRNALIAAIIVMFLIGSFYGMSRLTEINAAQEEEAGRNIKQNRKEVVVRPLDVLGDDDEESVGDQDNERKFKVDLQENNPASKNGSKDIDGNIANKADQGIKGQSGNVKHSIKRVNSTLVKIRNSDLQHDIQKSKSKLDLDTGDWPAPNNNLHIFYYPWYGNPKFDGQYFHWNHKFLPHWNKIEAKKWPSGFHHPPQDIGSNFYPDLACYSSRDPAVIEDHMKQMRLAGVGVLSFSWYPPNLADEQGQPSDDLIPLYLDTANKFGLKVTFHSEPYKDRNELTFLKDIQYIIDSYGKHPAFYRHRHKGRDLPVFYLYDSYLINSTKWARLFSENGDQSVRNTKYDAIFLGLYVEAKHKSEILKANFDGFYTYFASNVFTYASKWQNWKNLAEFARQRGLLFVPSVGPGYVDTRVRPWNNINTRQRDDGAYYEKAFQTAINAKPGIISVTSFNEWHEGTQIERAVPKMLNNFTYVDYGKEGPEKYLLLTQKWSKIFNG